MLILLLYPLAFPCILKYISISLRYNQLNCSYSKDQMEIITIHDITELSSYAVKKTSSGKSYNMLTAKRTNLQNILCRGFFFIVLLANLRFTVSDCLFVILNLSYANSVIGTALNHKWLVFTNSS
jgi:uncharacterized membrane protein